MQGLQFLTLILFFSFNAFATQIPLTRKGIPLTQTNRVAGLREALFCDVRAKLTREFYDSEKLTVRGVVRTEERVGWKMHRFEALPTSTGPCPSQNFEIIVRGALRVKDAQGNDRFIYREELPQPSFETKSYRIHSIEVQYGPGGKTHKEWRILAP